MDSNKLIDIIRKGNKNLLLYGTGAMAFSTGEMANLAYIATKMLETDSEFTRPTGVLLASVAYGWTAVLGGFTVYFGNEYRKERKSKLTG